MNAQIAIDDDSWLRWSVYVQRFDQTWRRYDCYFDEAEAQMVARMFAAVGAAVRVIPEPRDG